MRTLLAFLSIVIPSAVSAQLTIATGSIAKFKGSLSTTSAFSISSSTSDFSLAHLFLVGSDQMVNTNAPLSLRGLSINGGGTKTLSGNWQVTQDLLFTQGIVATSGGRLLYSGSAELTGNASSFAEGILYQRGTGTRFYPLGVGAAYTPMAFTTVSESDVEIGVLAHDTGPTLDQPLDIGAIASNRYWGVTTSGGTFKGSPTSLYIPGSSLEGSDRLVVLEADNAAGATAISLGGGVIADFVTSFTAATKPVLTIGVAEKVDIQINDLITPFTVDGINDELQILNVEYAVENKVTLMDRWGLVIKQWKNFNNSSQNFDFSKLSPGNYICVLEYRLRADSPKQELSQMVTILRGN